MERIYTEGDEFYAAALRMIRGARRSVFLNMYIFQDDEIGRLFQRALIRAARNAVRVHLIYDAVGSSAAPPLFWEKMRDGGVLVMEYLPFRRSRLMRPRAGEVAWWHWLKLYILRRNHRKILVCDGQVAMTGGFNIKRECSRKHYGRERWQDIMYSTDLPPIVRELEAIHLDSLRRARSPERDLRTVSRKRVREAILYPRAATAGAWWSRLLRNEAPDEVRGMRIARALKSRLRRAKDRIYLMFPYFIPYGGFLRILARQAAAGLDVRIYLSAISDLPWIQEITLLQAYKLYQEGVRVYLFHGRETPADAARFNHSKAVLIDEWAGTGSSNFDGRSFQLNLETFVLRHRPNFLVDLESYFARCERLSDVGQAENLRSGWRARLLYPFRRFL